MSDFPPPHERTLTNLEFRVPFPFSPQVGLTGYSDGAAGAMESEEEVDLSGYARVEVIDGERYVLPPTHFLHPDPAKREQLPPTQEAALLDLLTPDSNVNLSGGGTYELGREVPSVELSWGGIPGALTVTEQVISSDALAQDIAISDASQRSYTVSLADLGGAPLVRTQQDSVTFRVRVSTEERGDTTATTRLRWLPRVYYGYSAEATLTDAQLRDLGGPLKGGHNFSSGLNPQDEYIYYAAPASFGTPTLRVGPLSAVGWEVSADGHPSPEASPRGVTNAYGYTQPYRIFRAPNKTTGGDSFSAS